MRGIEPGSPSMVNEDEDKPPFADLEHEDNSPLQRKSRRKWLIGGVVFVIVALAVGLGAGLGTKRTSQLPSNSPLSALPNNSSSITSVVTRDALLGDTSRWLLSNRNFEISATPQIRTFNWTISQALSTPGGLTKPMILINGISPGPVLEANLGDRLIINVFNNMTNETAMHWHGQAQKGSNFMDGTYSITQCGIPPGEMMTYNWTVQNVGTSWYHAHKLAQYTDGMFGPIIFHSPNETAMTANSYKDDYTFILNDMYNTESSALNWRFEAVGTGIDGQPGDEPTPDGGMINGVSQAVCAYIPPTDLVLAERKKREWPTTRMVHKSSARKRSSTSGTFYPETNVCGNLSMTYFNATLVGGSTYRLRLINAGTFVNINFSIDNHTLTVIEADGTSVVPFNVSSINIAVAQRYSVLVTLNQKPGAYWIRNVLDTDQIRYSGPGFNSTTLGFLRYSSADISALPADLPAPALTANLTAFDTSSLVPAESQVSLVPTQFARVQFNMQYTSDNQHYMFFNQSSWSPLSPGNAAIFRVNQSVTASSLGSQVNLVNQDAGVMDLIVNSLDDGNHPFHLHGHTFQVMSQGDSQFYGDSSSLNASNPMRRDTIVVPSYGHVVLRFATDNPGVWAFHCHITWHMEIGLLLTVTDLPDQITSLAIPQAFRDMCQSDVSLGYK